MSDDQGFEDAAPIKARVMDFTLVAAYWQKSQDGRTYCLIRGTVTVK